MKKNRILKFLVATALLSYPVAVSPALAQQDDANDFSGIFEELDAEENADVPSDAQLDTTPEEAVPDTGAAADNPFDAYRESVNNQDQDPLLGGADNEGGAEPTPEDLEAEIRDEAFNAAVNGYLPLRPEEIRRFLEIYDEVKQASNTPVYPYPRSESKVEEVSLDPADPPNVIKLATGHVTQINFQDATGAHWPIAQFTWAGEFEVAPPEEEGGASIQIIPMSDYAYGNVVINLLDLQPPVILTLQAQREVVNARYDAIVPQPGPFAKPSIISNRAPTTTSGSVQAVSVLDGTPPQSASMMTVIGADSRTKAYNLGGAVYLRTPHTLISPAWSESASSGDGMNVYVIKNTPVVLLSDKGKILRTFLKEKDSNL